MTPTRRDAMALIALPALHAAWYCGAAAAAPPFSFDEVIALARARAGTPYAPAHETLPARLAAIDYDGWRDIRFRPDAELLSGAFRMPMFHPGFLYKHPVDMSIVRDGRAEGEARPAGARSPPSPHTRRFLVDFAGGDLSCLLREPDRIEAVPSVSRGRIDRHFLVPHPVICGFRAGIDVAVEPGNTTDIRVYLPSGERALTETWTFPWTNELG